MTSGVYASVTAGRGVAEGNIVETKILVCPVRLQLGPGLHHTYSMVYFKE